MTPVVFSQNSTAQVKVFVGPFLVIFGRNSRDHDLVSTQASGFRTSPHLYLTLLAILLRVKPGTHSFTSPVLGLAKDLLPLSSLHTKGLLTCVPCR